MHNLPTATELATKFDEVLRTHIEPEEYGEILRLNLGYRESECASHNYCDANMIMLEAMQSFGITTEEVLEDEQCRKLWNLAWKTWKSNG